MWSFMAKAIVPGAYAVYSVYDYFTDDESYEREDDNTIKKCENKNEQVYNEINKYKNKQLKRFQDKYGAIIEFHSGGVVNTTKLAEKISIVKSDEADIITTLEKETEEMIKLIGKLEVRKYETTS